MNLDTLAYIKTRSPLKVSLVFALGILLPSGFLSYLGLRSYRYEDRLMQKETEERFAAVADLVEKKVDAQVSELLAGLERLGEQPAFQRMDLAQILPQVLSNPKLNTLPIENLFVFNEADQMVAPWNPGTQPAIRGSSRRDVDWGPLADDIDRLERMEFTQKNVAGALEGYRALQLKTSEPSLQPALLKNIASDYRKLHQNRQAAATYQKLAHTFDALPDFSGVPTGLVARQMAIELYEEDKAWGEVVNTRLDLFEGFLWHRWKIGTAQRQAGLTEQRSALEKLFSTRPVPGAARQRWERLRGLQTRLESDEQSGERFAKNDWPDLLQRVRRLGRQDQGAVLQMLPLTHVQHLAVVVPIRATPTQPRRGLLVAVLPAEAVWPQINEVMDELAKPAGLKVDWTHSGSASKSPRRLWDSSLQREARTIDPPIRFRLIDVSSSTRDQLFHRRQWIFGGMIGLSFIVIIVGLVIMAQAVKRETEVANLKADFVANVSHELRTPLAAISHIGERLSLGRYRSDEERKEFYDLLGQETGRLRGLIEDILDFSKMLAGKKVYRREPLDLTALVQEALKQFKPKAEAREFEVSSHLPVEAVPIFGDSRALTQAILNLLDNALKYSGESRKIDVTVSVSGEKGTVAVKDYGIGIAESDKGKIFEKFYRIEKDTHVKEEGGVGLGLAMVKHVIEGHDGTIQVDSKVGKGTTFSLIFPLNPTGGSHGPHTRR